MITVEIKGTARCFDENGDVQELRPEVVYTTSTFDKAKRDSMALLQDEIEDMLADEEDKGSLLTLMSVQLDSIVDRKNNQRHYGQLPRHYCN